MTDILLSGTFAKTNKEKDGFWIYEHMRKVSVAKTTRLVNYEVWFDPMASPVFRMRLFTEVPSQFSRTNCTADKDILCEAGN